VITTTSADGTTVRAFDEGQGRVILVLHPGLDDGASWKKVAACLTPRFRVVRLHRRPYRLDIPCDPRTSIAHEIDDIRAVAAVIGERMLVVGHSSGGVVALEALVALPSTFAGAVVYEPPVVLGPPLGGDALERARAAIAAGKPGRAITIFVQDIVRLPPLIARLAGFFVAVYPRMRRFAARQIDEVVAIDLLGVRLNAYARIETPVVLLGGDRSPAHLGERLNALARVLPQVERVTLHGQGHSANDRAPDAVARVIANLADKALADRSSR
jgi:pimeloyl-ACP methyl ester carboxylesterase